MEVSEESYVIQPNVISRAIYIMPTMTRRLIFLAVFGVQVTTPSDMKVTMNLHNLAIMLGFHKTKRYEELKRAISIASKQVLRYEEENGNITEWIPWLSYCRLDLKTKNLTIQINERLYNYVLNIRYSAGFSIFLLSDYLQLESKYAYRWFEIIHSRSGHANKNNAFSFFIKYTISEIRTIFLIEEKKYCRIQDFKKNIIEIPIAEINKKAIGYKIIPEYKHTGKQLTSVFLRCKIIARFDGTEPVAMLIKGNVEKYFICYQKAKKIINIHGFNNTGSYNKAITEKAIELLKEVLQNE
jgi:hypothetical protein